MQTLETLTDLDTLTHRDVPMLIGGEWVPSESDRWIRVESPRDRSEICRVPQGSSSDVDRAVAAARAAFRAWRAVPAFGRGQALSAIASALEPQAERIARLISLENGNALRTQSRGEVKFVIDVFKYFGGAAQEAKGETLPLGEATLEYSRREPLGVVGAITAWNAPLQLAALKIAPALAAGNTIVLKPSEEAPLAVMEMARICQMFLPDGALNVVSGFGDEVGEALITHPDVSKLSFTGSTAVGSRIMAAAAERIVPVSLELGGKSPQVVFPDADEDWVADGVIAAMRFARQGQSCTAGSRLFVHDSIFESFLEKVVERLQALRIGDPLAEETDVGAIINRRQFDRVCSFIEEGMTQSKGRLVLGGMPPTEGPLSEGYFIHPTVFTGLDADSRIARDEIFGPVLTVSTWGDDEEVLARANQSNYGLAAYIWTHDVGRALNAAHSLEAGWVQVNQGGGQSIGQSYGGVKRSGIGREISLEGMLESYTQRKHVSVNIRR